MRKKGKHCKSCKSEFPECPCGTCVNDNFKANVVEYDMCCGKHEAYRQKMSNGNVNCRWTGECPDYVKEEE